MVIWAFVFAQLGVSIGLWSSAGLNIATGLSIVICMSMLFIAIFLVQKLRRAVSNPNIYKYQGLVRLIDHAQQERCATKHHRKAAIEIFLLSW